MLDVYKSVYNLDEQPFRLSPDCRFSFAHQSYSDAKSYLKYAISQGEGFVAITGAPGTGKTTLIASLLTEIDKSRVKVATLANIQLDPANLVTMVTDAFNVYIPESNQSRHLQELIRFLAKQQQAGRRSILIVDEAQGLTRSSLEDLRLLSNLQQNNNLLLQVFLVGQEPLLDMICAPGMEQLQQRMIAASHIKPLEFEETVAYIKHRLQLVGWNNNPSFSDESLELIHKFSVGVPRRINLICHRLFLHGGLESIHLFEGTDTLRVIVELHREGLLSPVVRRSLGAQADADNVEAVAAS